jgi:transcriptional regulator with XRE-family HTH domain
MANNLKKIRNQLGWTQEKAAERMGTTRNQITKLEASKRRLSDVWIERAAKAFGVDPGELVSDNVKTVHLVGYVGAGAMAAFFGEGQGENDEVDAPEGATEDTVAVEIRGESLGELFDRWLIFYDDVRRPLTADLIGHLCVVGLPDGRILVKKVRRGQLEGRFTLLSNTEPPIYDVQIDWAAKVRQMSPR